MAYVLNFDGHGILYVTTKDYILNTFFFLLQDTQKNTNFAVFVRDMAPLLGST